MSKAEVSQDDLDLFASRFNDGLEGTVTEMPSRLGMHDYAMDGGNDLRSVLEVAREVLEPTFLHENRAAFDIIDAARAVAGRLDQSNVHVQELIKILLNTAPDETILHLQKEVYTMGVEHGWGASGEGHNNEHWGSGYNPLPEIIEDGIERTFRG